MEVEDTVLLEDWAEHGLNDDAWAWVGDEGRLFVQLASEEIDAQVAMLAGGSGGGDPDDLARTALEHQEITHTDVVAWDGNGVWWWLRLGSDRSAGYIKNVNGVLVSTGMFSIKVTSTEGVIIP